MGEGYSVINYEKSMLGGVVLGDWWVGGGVSGGDVGGLGLFEGLF